jgi:hypothetical protein
VSPVARAFQVMCAVVCLVDCGDGTTHPTSTVGITLTGASPPSGSTIALRVHSNGEFSAPLAMTFTVVSDKDISAPIAEVTLGCMIGCGGGLPAGTQTLKANQPQTLTLERVQNKVSCSLPNTITSVHISVHYLYSTTDSNSFARDVPVSYTFVPEKPGGLSYPFCSVTGPCLGEPGGGFTTGMCHDSTWTCSTDPVSACLSRGGLACVLCPGPLCPVPLPPPEC